MRASAQTTEQWDEALDLARQLLAESPALETEVTVDALDESFARYASVGATQCGDRARVDVAIRVRARAVDGSAGVCEARATSTGLGLGDARAALSRAVALARVSAPDESLQPLGGPVEIAVRGACEAARTHSFAAKADWIDTALRACERAGLAGAGLAATQATRRLIANSAGRCVYGAASRAAFALTATRADASGFAEEIAADPTAIDPARAVERAIGQALRSHAPRAIAPGEYTVVLEPPAVAALLMFTAYQGFGARALEEQSSFLCGRIGTTPFARSLTLVDDAGHARLSAIPFDGEGSPRLRTVLIDAGRIVGPVTDRRYAAELRVPNTGHAQPQPNADGPRPQHLVLLPGDASIDALVSGVERGLYVSQLHYVNVIEPRELVLTGMTRHGAYWIENGRVQHAVKHLRFTESLVAALARVTGVGAELWAAGALFEGEMLAPALRIERFRFTSAAEFAA
ncbi:MAG: TldD/PmbA family protein [Planctomycetota bacterium]